MDVVYLTGLPLASVLALKWKDYDHNTQSLTAQILRRTNAAEIALSLPLMYVLRRSWRRTPMNSKDHVLVQKDGKALSHAMFTSL